MSFFKSPSQEGRRKIIPYDPRRYADEDVFVGRELYISELSEGLQRGHSYGLIGEPGIGKTSLLFAIKRELIRNQAKASMHLPIPVYLEFEKYKLISTEKILMTILLSFIESLNKQLGLIYPLYERDKLYEEINNRRFPQALQFILEWCFKYHKQLCYPIILFDDLHRGIACEWLGEAMAELRPSVYHGILSIVLSGELPLEEEFRNDISPLRQLIMDQKPLGCLSRKEVARLMYIAILYHWNVETDCEDLAYEVTEKGHPYRLHYYLFTALERYGKIDSAALRAINNDEPIRRFLNTVLKGGTSMTIEQDALQVAKFLQSLREQIFAHPEFERVYGDTGRELRELAADLTTNYQRLQETRSKLAHSPGKRRLQEDVDDYLNGLSYMVLEVQDKWSQFQTATLTRTETLISQIEQQTPAQVEQQASTEPEQQALKRGWFNTAVERLKNLRELLAAGNDIYKVAAVWSPGLLSTFREALDLLGQRPPH